MAYFGDGSNLTGVSGIPSGFIGLWSGATNAIPSGWVLCDGNNNTPNLTDRFVVGAGSSYSVDDTGGAASVTLTIDQIPSHNHSYNQPNFTTYSFTGGAGSQRSQSTSSSSTGSKGGGQSHENRPPYYALAYIMKT